MTKWNLNTSKLELEYKQIGTSKESTLKKVRDLRTRQGCSIIMLRVETNH